MPNPTLKGAGLSVDFMGLRALDCVSIELFLGEILGLIGPNGSGKTTLINVLCGQIPPSGGQTFCNGEDITSLPPREISKRGIARSFQIVRVFPNLTVRENIEVAAIAHGLPRRKVRQEAAELLDEFGLAARSEDLAGILSYGDKRRVEIARALASEPQFLLLDEPAAGMNLEETEDIARFILDIKEELDIAMILVEHDMGLVMDIADRVMVLDFGRKIADGVPEVVQRDAEVIRAYLGEEFESADLHTAEVKAVEAAGPGGEPS